MRDRLSSGQMSRILAANLKRLIKGKASQQEIADKVGMSRTALNKLLQGRVDPRLSTVQALADVLGKRIGELTGETDETVLLSRDARQIAEWYDSLDDPADRAYATTFFRKTFGFGSSPRGRNPD
jgi:transcriptional regulator with XRE-family HTH domain